MSSFLRLAAWFLCALLPLSLAHAGEDHIAKPWQLGFVDPATSIMEQLDRGHDYLLIIITGICLLVLMLLLYICLRFNRRRNPVPSKTAHNTRLEIIWTVIPILILVVIAIPSLRLHYFMQRVVDPEMTVKVVGYQWYWRYEYPDQGGFGFDSYMKKDNELAPGEHRLLAVDNRMVVPVNTKVRLLITGADVIHAFAVPGFGVKKDAVPGRLNESWFEAERTGTFYGQCSELCGVGHGFMPIVIDVVEKDQFTAWARAQRQKAGLPLEVQKDIAPEAAPTVPAEQQEKPPQVKPEPTSPTPEPEQTEQKERAREQGTAKPEEGEWEVEQTEEPTSREEQDTPAEDTENE